MYIYICVYIYTYKYTYTYTCIYIYTYECIPIKSHYIHVRSPVTTTYSAGVPATKKKTIGWVRAPVWGIGKGAVLRANPTTKKNQSVVTC